MTIYCEHFVFLYSIQKSFSILQRCCAWNPIKVTTNSQKVDRLDALYIKKLGHSLFFIPTQNSSHNGAPVTGRTVFSAVIESDAHLIPVNEKDLLEQFAIHSAKIHCYRYREGKNTHHHPRLPHNICQARSICGPTTGAHTYLPTYLQCVSTS